MRRLLQRAILTVAFMTQGIDLQVIKDIKEGRRGRISEYVAERPSAKYTENGKVWGIPCDIALPCATQNELTAEDARELVKNGCIAVGEGANMPSTHEAIQVFLQNGVLFAPEIGRAHV